jgi:hypothetical protein
MPRPPYQDEGILGPGGRRFVAVVVAIAVVVGIGVAALEIDFSDLGDEIEGVGEPTSEEPNGGSGSDGDKQPEPPEAQEPAALSTGGLAHALRALGAEVGGDPNLLRVMATPAAIELDVRGGDEPTGFRWSDGELTELPIAVVIGRGRLPQRDFPGSEVDPGSLGRLLKGARRHGGGRELDVVNAILEEDVVERRLRWVLNATAPNGANLNFRARPSGRGVTRIDSAGALGAQLPAQSARQLKDAQRLGHCIDEGGGSFDAITRCSERFTP